MVRVTWLRGAEEDLQQSVDWYAEKSQVAAEKFEAAVADAITRILENPNLGIPLAEGIHCRRVPSISCRVKAGIAAQGAGFNDFWLPIALFLLPSLKPTASSLSKAH